MIKIISDWSNKGGSTFAFIRLTNALNEAGYETTFYGPHEWHLDKCNAALLKDFIPRSEDIVIAHFLNLQERPPVKKVILSCHEKNLFEVGKIPQFWDKVIFLNKKHKQYHSQYRGKYAFIPNLKEPLEKKEKTVKNIAGIIGSFDENKQVHISIERALSDGMEKVLLFGKPTERCPYYNHYIKPLLSDKVIEVGFFDDKQEMYDMISDVYASSKSEVASLVKDECETTGTKFHGNYATTHDGLKLTNEEIINKWIKELEL